MTGPRAVEWNPADYAANSASQQAWARELISRLRIETHEAILDVGCGDGKITAELARAVPDGWVVGIDTSPDMIRYAKKVFSSDRFANLEFHLMDARRIRLARSFDRVFSNAALHWVDDHPAFLEGAASILRPGGKLIVSCGGKGNAQEVFAVLRGEMRLKRWRDSFRNLKRPYFFYSPEDYERWLTRFGFRMCRVELAAKDMVLADSDGFAGWFRTTWLPYTQRVPESEREEFIAAIVQRYEARHPADPHGRVHVKMVRLEIEAIRA